VKVKDASCLAIMLDDDTLVRRVASEMSLEE
jgi:hypothetical protein